MRITITESQFHLIMETSLFIKRRVQLIQDALDHALLPTSVIQPEDYSDWEEYMDGVILGIDGELSYDNPGYISHDEFLELEEYVKTYHWEEIKASFDRVLQDYLNQNKLQL